MHRQANASGSDPTLIGNSFGGTQSFSRRDTEGGDSAFDDSKCAHISTLSMKHFCLILFALSVPPLLNRFHPKVRIESREDDVDPDDPYDAQPIYQ